MMIPHKKICILILIITNGFAYAQSTSDKIIVPLGGNSWVHVSTGDAKETVTDSGWQHWENPTAVWSTYIKLSRSGTIKISADPGIIKGESKLKWTVNGISKIISIRNTGGGEITIGEWKIGKPGYVRIDAQGISKSGELFAQISELKISGTAVDDQTAFVKSKDDNYFYWGRRGPSVHINYDLSEIKDSIEWFYNEITVPSGNDVTGSYFMADGFGQGYFGMQVNSPAERRVLFSVWSPFNTDDPKAIPEDKKIILLKKGKDVHAGEFGNEGSGGQSYLQYNWKAGDTYKFLLSAKPGANNFTAYTAYFYDAANKQWLLIASFNRPATNTWLTKLHSFLENFIPETGDSTRRAYYHNQWVRTKGGEWKAINKMSLTADATARKGYRMDYGGGVNNGQFYLQNCGFFNESAVLKKQFTSEPGDRPVVNLEDLP